MSLIGISTDKMLPVIREVITEAKDIPFSDKGGAWALMQKEGYGSYLMNFGTLTEESAEEWIKMCKNLGFNQLFPASPFFTVLFSKNSNKVTSNFDNHGIINRRSKISGWLG